VAVAVTTTFGYSGGLWRVLWEHGYKEVFWCLAVNGVRTAGTCQRYFQAHALVVLWS
jgi:putative hemolysin